MNDYTAKKIQAFMGILKHCGLKKEEIFGIVSMMKTEEMVQEIVNQLESKDFKTTPQETMNICGQVIKESLHK